MNYDNPRWFRTRKGPISSDRTLNESRNDIVYVTEDNFRSFMNNVLTTVMNGENSGTEYGVEVQNMIDEFINQNRKIWDV